MITGVFEVEAEMQEKPEPNNVVLFENTLLIRDFGIHCRIDENTARELCIHRGLITWNQADYCYKVIDYANLQLIRDIIQMSNHSERK